jgi:thiol-disulfide isomerase/thioredoxin
MRGRLAIALAAAALAALAWGCSGREEAENGGSPERPPGGVYFWFDRFTAAPLVDGGEVTLDSLKGKVVLLDLFGTWCPPCRRSVPVIVSLYERYRGRGFEIVGLAYERTDNPAEARELIKRFREEFKIAYRVALGPAVVWEELKAKANADEAIPTVLLLDRKGTVRDMFQGLKAGQEAEMADRIEQLMAEPAPPSPK